MARNLLALSLAGLTTLTLAASVNAQSYPNQDLWEKIRNNQASAPSTAPADSMSKPTDSMSKPMDPAMSKPTDSMSKPSDPMMKPADTMMKKDADTIVDVAVKAGSFKTLTKALEAAGLVETLKGKGPFTVFAPTDAAFAALPAGTVETLLKPENKEKLVKILTYHVVAAEALSTSLKNGPVKTVQGSDVTVKLEGSTVLINDAKVTKADIKASNGVIHVIDKVIMPPN